MTEFTKEKSAWVTWEIQTRNRSMAKLLGIPLFELIIKKPRYIKYPILILRTIGLVLRNKIAFLFVQNPSIVLAFLAVILKSIFRIRVIVDAHNAGIYPLEGRSSFLNGITKFIVKRADVTIVTNANLAEATRKLGGRPFVMPDPLPQFSINRSTEISHDRLNAFFICTWADDEPYWEVIKAARLLGDEVSISVTGNYKKKLTEEDIRSLPANIKLLGFVDEEVFVETFANSDVSVDLTTRDDCLVCGAYESIALNVPGVVSESSVNRETFTHGFVYTRNDAANIAQALRYCRENSQELLQGINTLRELHHKKVSDKATLLVKHINSLS